MADNLQQLTVLCAGGLNTTENHLLIDSVTPGGAAELINYEVGLYGGYRRIEGFAPYDADYEIVDDAGAEGPILGIIVYTDLTNNDHIFAARKQQGAAEYELYEYDSATGWTIVTTGLTLATTSGGNSIVKIRHEKFVFGGTNYVMLVDGVNQPVLYDGTTWYQLTDAGAGTSASPGGDQMINHPQFIKVFKNHIFLAGGCDCDSMIAHSAPEDPFNFTVASGAGQLSAGAPAQAIMAFRDSLFVFGRERIRKVVESNLTFVIEDVASNIGCIAPDSVIEVNGDVFFLAQDGVRTVSGTDKIGDVNLASVSRPIQKYVNELQSNYDLAYLNSVVIKGKSQFRYFVSTPSATAVGIGLIGGLRDGNNGVSLEFSKLTGIRTSCTEVDYINNVETIFHGDYNGGVYKQESGMSFNGENITSTYKTPYLAFSDPLIRKLARKMLLFTKPEASFEVTVTARFDWKDPEIVIVAPYTGATGETTSVYDGVGVEYDGTGIIYASDDIYPVITYDLEQSFKSVQYTFTTNQIAESHSIQGFIIEFSTEGKR